MQGGTLFNLPPYTGQFDLNLAMATCTECSFTSVPSCPNDALKLGFWPGGPLKSKYLFNFLLLEMFDLLQKQMPGVSEGGFLRVLELLSEKRGRVSLHLLCSCMCLYSLTDMMVHFYIYII